MTAIWWIRRDLRLMDNPPLHAALDAGSVIPVFILAPRLPSRPAAHRQDFLILWMRRNIKANTLVEDHPTRAGCCVLEPRTRRTTHMTKAISSKIGLAPLRALFKEKSLLCPLKVMAGHVGRFFQISIPGFRPYVVFGPEAVRKVLVTERDKVLWRNVDPVTDLLQRSILITDGEEHDRYRKLMEPPLHRAQLPAYTQMMIA